MAERYNPSEIERKWQERWEADGIYRLRDDDSRPKFYFLTMFPYTSGDLHAGHWYAEAPADIASRFLRMKGFNVLRPMGFDAFGLPAENAAIQRGIHPYTWTMGNIETMRRQIKTMGSMYDWEKEVITCLPEYYKWNQWFFLKLYEKGLAYRAKAPANWCPGCQTTLANEQVTGEGVCERCKTPVTHRELEQWFFRITQYADELLDFSKIQWPERICIMQKNWIGRSEGVEVSFPLERADLDEKEIRVFTTRPDTIYGVTFMVLAPEHPLVEKLTGPEYRAQVDKYVAETRRKSEIERQTAEQEKTGVFIGAYCINRFSGQRVPIYIADYALLHYGTGAVMGVPAHDYRDFAFAKRYRIPIVTVIAPPAGAEVELPDAYVGPGPMVNSGPFDGTLTKADWGKMSRADRAEVAETWGFAVDEMESRLVGLEKDGIQAVAEYMEEKGWGQRTVSYRLRDWLISRQRYWGTPIPIVYCPSCGVVPIPETDLPVLLPEDAEFRPTGESPLKYHTGFLNAPCPQCRAAAQRETDTMDTFVDSSWYFLRYLDPHHQQGPFHPQLARKWLPVDQYTGGAEHAVMHLLYSRFFIKALRDIGLVDFDEPFARLFNQGIILGEDHEKMSKSRGNVVNPDQEVERYGADTVRAFLAFVGPWDEGGSWSSKGIVGIYRWFNRVCNLVLDTPPVGSPGPMAEDAAKELRRWTHRTIKRVSQDLEKFRFNTMLAALMEYTNYLTRTEAVKLKGTSLWKEALDTLVLLLAPTAPHLAEELWMRTGHPYSIHNQPFPIWDEALAAEEEFALVVQINGKVRERAMVPISIAEAEARELAMSLERVKAGLSGKEVVQVIYVPKRLVNIVTR